MMDDTSVELASVSTANGFITKESLHDIKYIAKRNMVFSCGRWVRQS
jgi:hypothetical protein